MRAFLALLKSLANVNLHLTYKLNLISPMSWSVL